MHLFTHFSDFFKKKKQPMQFVSSYMFKQPFTSKRIFFFCFCFSEFGNLFKNLNFMNTDAIEYPEVKLLSHVLSHKQEKKTNMDESDGFRVRSGGRLLAYFLRSINQSLLL